MRNKISAIIIDPEYKKHDYSEVKTNDGNEYSEDSFELKILDSGDDILRNIYEFNGVDSIITVGDKSSWKELSRTPFSIRKKWTHLDKFDPHEISNNIVSTFLGNLSRNDAPLQFSFFTCTHNTDKQKLMRLYRSMCSQTYAEWDWFIVDDSDNYATCEIINSLKDPRITVVKTITWKGNIGFNKHLAAMMCDGDFICEVDHDDELVPKCLHYLKAAFEQYPDSDFIYSNCLELKGSDLKPIIYGKGWGWGEGLTKTEVVNGKEYTFSESPGVNGYSIRTIYAQPNHIRCWKKDFYHKIGGHNTEMSVLDDQELITRTFLYGKMTKVDKVLYIQYEGDGERGVEKDNTQSVRFGEIQRTTMLLKNAYDKKIHDRITRLGYEDDAWNATYKCSYLNKSHTPGLNMTNNIYIPTDEA